MTVTVGPARSCEDGEHRVPIYLEDERPQQIRCLGCGKLFVRDPSSRQGYRGVGEGAGHPRVPDKA